MRDRELSKLGLPPCEVEDEEEKPDPQRLALIALYNATNGDQWTRNDGWLSNNPLKHWRGVTVDDFGRVIRLGLGSNDMQGKIPPELRHLTALQTLHLSDNSLSGEIPPELGQLSDLTELWLGDNELSGEIPPQLGQLAKLEYLDLLLNQLSGKIPPELGNLTNLKQLLLNNNQLSGQIPPELGNLTGLESVSILDISDNQLTGCVPPRVIRLMTEYGYDWVGLLVCGVVNTQ